MDVERVIAQMSNIVEKVLETNDASLLEPLADVLRLLPSHDPASWHRYQRFQVGVMREKVVQRLVSLAAPAT